VGDGTHVSFRTDEESPGGAIRRLFLFPRPQSAAELPLGAVPIRRVDSKEIGRHEVIKRQSPAETGDEQHAVLGAEPEAAQT
jgi:hypothetical protein